MAQVSLDMVLLLIYCVQLLPEGHRLVIETFCLYALGSRVNYFTICSHFRLIFIFLLYYLYERGDMEL